LIFGIELLDLFVAHPPEHPCGRPPDIRFAPPWFQTVQRLMDDGVHHANGGIDPDGLAVCLTVDEALFVSQPTFIDAARADLCQDTHQ
jgi:hypothetical protein